MKYLRSVTGKTRPVTGQTAVIGDNEASGSLNKVNPPQYGFEHPAHWITIIFYFLAWTTNVISADYVLVVTISIHL